METIDELIHNLGYIENTHQFIREIPISQRGAVYTLCNIFGLTYISVIVKVGTLRYYIENINTVEAGFIHPGTIQTRWANNIFTLQRLDIDLLIQYTSTTGLVSIHTWEERFRSRVGIFEFIVPFTELEEHLVVRGPERSLQQQRDTLLVPSPIFSLY